MTPSTEKLWQRLGVISRLVILSPESVLGRTAIMKLLYLLQEVRKVPLEYNFRLYTYGPFDSDVLFDLGTADCLQLLGSKTVLYSAGYGYEIKPGRKANNIPKSVAVWLSQHEEDIAWAVNHFAQRSASELELLATIIYVNHRQPQSDINELARRVRDVKPRFNESYVLETCTKARRMELIPTG